MRGFKTRGNAKVAFVILLLMPVVVIIGFVIYGNMKQAKEAQIQQTQ